MKEWIAVFLVLFALFFAIVGVVGLYRLKDPYQRLHVTSKFNLFALSALLICTGLLVEDLSWSRIFITFVLLVITSPLTSHIIASAAYERGVEFKNVEVKDDL